MSRTPVPTHVQHPAAEPATGHGPTTGLPAVDEALARLGDLDERPVSEHHEALAAAHETLHSTLQPRSVPTDD